MPCDLDQERGVDVPAGENRADGSIAPDLPGQESGHRGGARALDDELHPLEQEHDRVCDLGVGDGDDVVEAVGEDASRELSGLLDGDAVRDRDATRLEAGERRTARCLHTDEVDLGPQLA